MVFTEEEESIVRLLIDELRTRKKLDEVRKDKDTELRKAMAPIKVKIDNTYKVEYDSLSANYVLAEKAIENMFIEQIIAEKV